MALPDDDSLSYRLVTGFVHEIFIEILHTFPAADFGALYHQRWRIEEALKRLKHRLNLEHVSGLSQLAVMQDFAAKVLCDNLQALACLAATEEDPLPEGRRINHAYAPTSTPS